MQECDFLPDFDQPDDFESSPLFWFEDRDQWKDDGRVHDMDLSLDGTTKQNFVDGNKIIFERKVKLSPTLRHVQSDVDFSIIAEEQSVFLHELYDDDVWGKDLKQFRSIKHRQHEVQNLFLISAYIPSRNVILNFASSKFQESNNVDGWIRELLIVLNSSKRIFLFDSYSFYSTLRFYVPTEQVITNLRLKTVDLASILRFAPYSCWKRPAMLSELNPGSESGQYFYDKNIRNTLDNSDIDGAIRKMQRCLMQLTELFERFYNMQYGGLLLPGLDGPVHMKIDEYYPI